MTRLTWLHTQIADKLYSVGAIKFGAFKLRLHQDNPDAPLSPIYLNLRTANHPKNPGPLTPEIMDEIGVLFARMKIGEHDCFVDLPDAGEPFGDQWEHVSWMVGSVSPPERLRMRKVITADGSRHFSPQIDGGFHHGMRCLVIDDLITQADSKLDAIKVLQAAGLVVEDILVLVDREQGGREQLAATGFRLHSAFGLEDLLSHYVEQATIGQAKADEVRAYIAANRVVA